jgi:hypothetical protein
MPADYPIFHYEERAEAFYDAFRQLRPGDTITTSWPHYLLLCHAVELGLKAFLAARGVSEPQLRTDFGHKIDPLMREALTRGLNIGVLAASEIMQLDEAHAKHWSRYPRQENKPVFVIEFFEPYVRELLQAVSISATVPVVWTTSGENKLRLVAG